MLTHVGLLAALRRAARYHEIRDDDLNGLVVLVERRRSHLDQSLIWTGPRGPHLEDLALDPQLIPGSHGSWPAELVSPGAHDAARGFEVAFDQEPHGDRKSTRLNSSHLVISYAVFCLKKKNTKEL